MIGRAGVLIAALATAACSADASRFPLIRPFEQTFRIRDLSKDNLSLTILSEGGAPVYRLQCHSPDVDAPEIGNFNFQWSGDFECQLLPSNGRTGYTTLLTDEVNQDRDWESRGRFFSKEIKAPCGSIPEFGTKRNFRLRRMKLTLEIREPQFMQDGKLEAFDLRVTASQDRAAMRPIAEYVPIPSVAPEGCEVGLSTLAPLKGWERVRGMFDEWSLRRAREP